MKIELELFEFEGENWDVYVCNMIIGEIDDTKGNSNSKMMGNGRHFISSLLLIQQKNTKSLH